MLTTQHGLKYIRSVHMFLIPCVIFIPWVICEYSPFPSQNFISKISTFLHGTFSLHQYFLSLKVIPQFCTGKSFTADKNHVIRRISARIPRTRYCFSINGPGKEVQWSVALERARWPIFFYCIILVYKLFPLNWTKLEKKSHRREKKM